MAMRARWPLYGALVCSGAAALIYETTWTRLLGLLMGHTSGAVTSVLAAFMLGLALGALAVRRISLRLSPWAALRAYALFELCIGIFALLIPAELVAARPLLALAYSDGDATIRFGIVRFAIGLAVVTLPAIAMGATLPLVVAGRRPGGDASRDVARMYAANTVGAATGAIVSGFVLLPALGMQRVTWIAIGLNVASAAIAMLMSVNASRTPGLKPQGSGAGGTAPSGLAVPRSHLVAWCLALSGAASLMLQVAWTRILALVMGPTTYAFSAMVATFIAGIAIGAVVAGSLARSGHARRWLAVSLIVSGVMAALASATVPWMLSIVAGAVSASGATFQSVILQQAAMISLVMLAMTTAFGASFAFGVRAIAHNELGIAADTARLYFTNTIGAIAGALGAGLALVPLFGLEWTVRIAGLLCLVGAAVAWASQPSRRWAGLATVSIIVVAIVMAPRWDKSLISSGAYKYAAYLPLENREALLRAGTLLFYREGALATVSVRRSAGTVALAIDGKVDASDAGDMVTQRLLAHVPLLLHPDPKRVGVIGLGSGVTIGSALAHPVERVDAIEISREVVKAAAYFGGVNDRALNDRRVRIIKGDGRSHMRLGTSKYDVVISEPSNPWMAGVAGLFTREMFESIRDRLNVNGIVCQWAHAYDMSAADLRSIVATFVEVFPEATLWAIGENDVLLVGSMQPIEPRLRAVTEAWNRPGVAANLASVSASHPGSVLSLYAAGTTALRAFARNASVQRDDRLALEFTGPRSIFGRSQSEGVEAVRSLQSASSVPAVVREARRDYRHGPGLLLLRAEAYALATDALIGAVREDPSDPAAIDGLIRAAALSDRLDAAEAVLRELLHRTETNVEVAIGLSRALASRGRFQPALAMLEPFLKDAPHVRALEQSASVRADAGDSEGLAAVVSRLQEIDPDSDATVYFSGVTALMGGRPHAALDLAKRLTTRQTGRVKARDFTLAATAAAALRRTDEARRAFQSAVDTDPRDVTAYENLATFELEAGDTVAASGHFAEALLLNPRSSIAQEGLRKALMVRR